MYFFRFTTPLVLTLCGIFSRAQTAEWLYSFDAFETVRNISALPNGNMLISGFASSPVLFDFEGDNDVLNDVGWGIVFAEFGPDGGLNWHKVLSDTSGGTTMVTSQFVDHDGNIYIHGSGDTLTNFAPGVSTPVYFETQGSRWYEFLAKYDPNGEFQWVRPSDWIHDADFDGEGNMYTATLDRDTVMIEVPQGDSTVEREYINFIGTIQKVDPLGNAIWQKQIRASRGVRSQSIRYSNGSLYYAGTFADSVDVDPGPEKDLYTTGYPSVEGSFLVQFDTAGNRISSAGWAGGMGEAFQRGLEIDEEGSVYLSGNFGAEVDFDPGPDTVMVDFHGTFAQWVLHGNADVFILKLKSDLSFDWVRTIGGYGYDRHRNFALTPDGVVCSGIFYDSLWLEPSAQYLHTGNIHYPELFMANFSSEGDLLWSLTQGGGGSIQNYDLAADADGNVYASGQFSGLMVASPATAFLQVTLPDAGNSHYTVFFEKFNPAVVNGANDHNEPAEISVFPNPTQGPFSISSPTISSGTARIINVFGAEVLRVDLTEDRAAINHSLLSGAYLVQFFDDEETFIGSRSVVVY